MKLKFITILALLLLRTQTLAQKQAAGISNSQLPKPMGRPRSTLVNINNLSMWIRADGWSARNPHTGNSGVIFPPGTAGLIFLDGIIWAGLVKDGKTPELRAGGQIYNIGTLEGRIISKGVAEDPNDADVRIWRIRHDWQTADLTRDAAELNDIPIEQVTGEQIRTVREQYERDWNAWPWQKGAPFYDNNGNGIMDPDEEPGLAEADQVVWFVANDLSASRTFALFGSPPIGLEFQGTLWAYNREDALGNVIFKRYRLIYKGTAATPDTAHIDSVYIGQFSDPDLGTYADDFVGVDTLLSMGYAYNSTAVDEQFSRFELAPPAIGYDLLKGPLGSPDHGAAQPLLLTSFVYIPPVPPTADPAPPDFREFYNLLRGFLPFRDPENPEPFRDPQGNPTKFTLSGDPISGAGWIDGQIFPPGDRRFLMSSGPFTMALGDTQDVVIALVAGLGQDNLTSISALKFYDQDIQVIFDNAFKVPHAPQAPKLQISEMDKTLLLNWGFDQTAVEATEEPIIAGYTFEGYNIYQFPSPNAGWNEAIKMATFDLKNGVRGILHRMIDPETGLEIVQVAQAGKDTGVQYTLFVTQDSISKGPLINYRPYYFAVTAYNYNANGLLTSPSFESPLIAVAAVPHPPEPGIRHPIAFGDTLETIHDGFSRGKVYPIVVDPTKTTGHTYQVSFHNAPDGQVVWEVRDLTIGSVLLANQTNQSGDDKYLVVDGVLVKVVGVPKDFARTPARQPAIIEVQTDSGSPQLDSQGAEFGGNQVWHSFNSPPSDGRRYFISACGGRGDENQLTNHGETLQNLVPFDLEVRFTTEDEGSMVWWAFEDGSLASVPLQVWNVGPGTFDDPSDDVRLIPVAFSGGDSVGGTPGVFDVVETVVENSRGAPGFDCLFFYSGDYNPYAADARDGIVDEEHRDNLLLANFMIADAGILGLTGLQGRPPGPGTVIRIFTTKPNTPGVDEFSFTTPAPEFNRLLARNEIDRVNVFPNPYLGLNRLETSRFQRFVTFTHLPRRAIIRIFNLAGTFVKKITKNDESPFVKWNLRNESNRFVASGLYLAHIEMPELGKTKILKLALVLEQLY